MSSLKQIEKTEKDNLQKLERLESKALFFTANKLSKGVKAAIESGTAQPDALIESYANTYTAAMMVSWLLGQVHTVKAISNAVLDDAPILLAVDPVPFKEALDALEAMIPTDTQTYRQTEAAMKLRAFTIANVSGLEAVDRVKKLYQQAIDSGDSRAQTLQNIDAFLKTQGIAESNPYWLELHYRNNMMTAYNAGRWTQVAENDLVEFLVYTSVLDSGTTELCKMLDNVVKAKDDPFWEEYYPPNHHKCRGTVSVLSREQYSKLPDDIKNKSQKIDGDAIREDETLNKEHQFRSSPVLALKSIPETLATNAKEYGLNKKILSYSYDQSKKVLKAQQQTSAALAVSADVVKKAIKAEAELEPFAEMITERLPGDADEVWFGFDTLANGDVLPVLQYVLHLDSKRRAIAMVAAYDDPNIYAIKSAFKTDLKEQQKEFIDME